MFPNADQIATAIVTACRLTGDDPLAVPGGASGSRARNLAWEALRFVFPKASRFGLGRCVGYAKPQNACQQVNVAKRAAWWNEDHVDEVVGALVADSYGEQGS